MTVDDSSLNNIFFFGAGASVKAGVKTTFGLVETFETFISAKTKILNLFHEILSILQSNNHKVDIEELLQTIDRLEKRDEDNLVKFYETKGFKLKDPKTLELLKSELKVFINNATSVNGDKINYLEPLFSYPKPTLIFSLNYDTAIEQLCNVYKKTYTDGFDYSWNPKLFENNKLDFHLYKLHGSIMWYKTDRGDYLKLPLPPKEEKVELIFGEKAHHLMLYPMQKWEFDEPLLEMMQQFRAYLENVEAVIVVGYSFRDPYMIKILHDAARKNRKLFIILIDPNARKIYDTQLRYYNIEEKKSTIPSSLENRVLCLQYNFEDVLPIINHFSSDAKGGLTLEEKSTESSYSGGNSNWYSNNGPLNYFIKSEFIDRADQLFDKIDWAEEIKNDPFKVFKDSFKMFLLAEEHGFSSNILWLRLFLKSSYLISTVRQKISIDMSSKRVSYLFSEDPHSGRPFHALETALIEIIEFFRRKRENIPKDSLSNDLVTKLIMLTNFVILRSSNEKTMDFIIDGDMNPYSDKRTNEFVQALSNYQNNENGITWENLTLSFKTTETLRLAQILGGVSLKEYLEKIIQDDKSHPYQKYSDALK